VTPWYVDYFTADYWDFTEHEYGPDRTASEVDYLAAVLAGAPGRRVLDLGCGTGRHAVPLARRGFAVTGLDVSGAALERARAAGPGIPFHRADLLLDPAWPGPSEVDAVVCVQGFAWGTDADQLRLLRRVRSVLAPGGLLVLDVSNATPILAGFRARDEFEAGGTRWEFRRDYDPLTGHNRGDIRVTRPDGRVAVLPHDVRLYQPPEVARLLAEAGFVVERVDAEFRAGSAVLPGSRYVQFVARAGPRPAVDSHRAPVPAGVLDLRWAPDEVELVRPALAAAWAEVPDPAEVARDYAVTDPYGSQRLAAAVSAYHGCPVPADRIVAGAGTTGLLRDLARLAAGGCVLAERLAHPELPSAGVRLVVDRVTPETVLARRPAVVLLDRPGVAGEVRPLGEVRELARAAAAVGARLVLDETCAAYLGPGESAVPLALAEPALVVLRSLSKGWCSGGLRAGYAVGPGLRPVVTPLACSALSVAVAARLLARGDVFAPLRDRVAAAKPDLVNRLRAAGFSVRPGDPRLPWVLASRGDLPAHGVAGRELSTVDGRPAGWTRVSVPLTAARSAELRARLPLPVSVR
jgi:histidinol-phosphate/aromatic aminotransferase/cobyric acid decarboxylase-like protein/SAM-dependent methyltransferase